MRCHIFKYKIHTEILINAPKSLVWKAVTDLSHYYIWNPHIYLLQGEVKEGGTIIVQLHWPGLKPNNYKLKITELNTEKKLSWTGHFKIPGLLNGHHHFLLKDLEYNKTQVIQHEYFTGLLVPFVKPWLRTSIWTGFLTIDRELADYCEGHLKYKS